MRLGSLMKIGAVIAIGLTVLTVGLVIAIRSVHLDQVKALLISQVKSATGRTLTITGPLELQLGLVPSMVVTGVTLSNPPGATRPEMVKLDRFEMEFALQPLLKKEIVVNRVLLNSPDILIETETNGPGNLDFSHPDEERQPQPTATSDGRKQAAETPFSFKLNEVKIQTGKITWHDRTNKKTEIVGIETLSLRPDTTDVALLAVQSAVTIRNQRINLSGTMGRINTLISGKPWPVKMSVGIAGVSLTAEGNIAEIASFRGVDLKVAAQGTELGEMVRLADMTKTELPPNLGPFKILARLNDSGKQFHLVDVDLQAGKHELLLLKAKGTVNDLAGTFSPDLTLYMESDNPVALSSIAGFDIPLSGPAKFSGQLFGSGTAWKVTNLQSVVGESDLAGELMVQWAKQPHLSGKLTSTSLNPADFSALSTSSSRSGTQSGSSKSGGDGRFFSDDPLPMTFLHSMDADVHLQMDKLLLDTHQLTDLGISLQLKSGRLSVKPFRFGLAGGTFEGEANVDAVGKTPLVALRLQGRQFELDKLQQGGVISGGKSDLKVDVKGSGTSVRALMASATGETVLSVGESRLRNKSMDWAAGDLLFQVLGALNPLAKSEDTTQMSCAVVRFLIRDGVATADKGIALRTAKVDVVGSGTVDLRSERLDLGIKPRARGGVGLSLSTPLAGLVRVGGTLAKPSIGIDAGGSLKTAASVGAGVATGGLSVLGELLVDKVASDDDPCRTALGKPQPAQVAPRKETQKSSKENIFQGIFGR